MKRFLAALTALILSAALFCAGVSAFDANDYDYSFGGGGDGGHSYSSGSLDSGGDLESLLIAIPLVAIMCVYLAIKDKIESHRKKRSEQKQAAKTIPNRTAEIQNAVRRFDPGFDSETMKTYAKKVFVDLHTALSMQDPEPLRGVLLGQLFDSVSSGIADDKYHNIMNRYENIGITQSWLTSYVRENGFEYLTVYLNTKYIGYCIDTGTGAILRGDRNTECKQRYLMTFVRSTASTASLPQSCPHCGAPTNVANQGICEYCGSTVAAEAPRWLLGSYAPVSGDTQDYGIRIS